MLNLKFTHVWRHTCVIACLMHVKLQKLACVHIVICNFGMHTQASEHMGHTKDARHELTFGLPHYTCKSNCFTADELLNYVVRDVFISTMLGYLCVLSGQDQVLYSTKII